MLSSRPDFEFLNQGGSIGKIFDVVPNGCHAASDAKIVRMNWLRRETIYRTCELVTEVETADDIEIATALEKHLGQLADAGRTDEKIQRTLDVRGNSERLDAAPTDEWRLLIAFSRFAGLRVPSEPCTLRWRDIDW